MHPRNKEASFQQFRWNLKLQYAGGKEHTICNELLVSIVRSGRVGGSCRLQSIKRLPSPSHCLPAHHQQSHFQNSIVGGLAGLANRIQEMVGTEAEVDDDVAGSALEDLAELGVWMGLNGRHFCKS